MENPKSEAAETFERSSKLAEEILEAQKCRSDFLKWKLLLVAALGGVGLGLQDKVNPAPLLLALIPLVCLYVDLVCANLSVRQIVIGTFYATIRQDSYERFVQRNRHVFNKEDWALYRSTYVICIIVALIGVAFIAVPFTSDQEARRERPVDSRPVNVGMTNGMVLQIQTGSAEAPTPATTFWQKPLFQGIILAVTGLSGWFISLHTRKKHISRIRLLIPQVETQEIQNKKMAGLMRPNYTATELKTLYSFLAQKGVFIFRSLPNGLFPAAAAAAPNDVSGYQYVWVRDNVHIAHAHYVCGDGRAAGRTLSALMEYFRKHRNRFREVIEKKADASDPMNRPHVRFDGTSLAEINQPWAHAQNDALGYFLWCYCKLAREGVATCGDQELECLVEFPLYFHAIQYWKDKDSGHWEEARKVSASSIGTVVAGLREFQDLMGAKGFWQHPVLRKSVLAPEWVSELRQEGETALAQILPCESVEPAPLYRRYDSALLFLIYPLEVLPWSRSKVILEDIKAHLQGDYGIRRYVGDSYWCADYTEKFPAAERTADFSKNMEKRDAHVRPGEEAQWCIFDSIISAIYARRLRDPRREKAEDAQLLQLQTNYLNRALGQLTREKEGVPEFRAPEAYYLKKGDYVPNDHTPLLWSQANLWLALHEMEKSIENSA